MDKIVKAKPLAPSVVQAMEEAGEHFKVGDLFFHSSYGNQQIIKVFKIEKATRTKWDNNRNKYEEEFDQVTYARTTTWDASEFKEGKSTMPLEELLNGLKEGNYVRIDKPFTELQQEAQDVITGKKSIEDYKDPKSDAVNNENALMARANKDVLIAMKNEMDIKRRKALVIAKAVGWEMERKKQELEKVKDQMYAIMKDFKDKMDAIQRVITSIEIYLGINEELHQLQAGEKAPADTPISFRQLVLYMDEEYGVYEDGGIDFQDIEIFDEWLIKGKMYNKLLPEQKGMVVLRPRRNPKKYSDDPIYNAVKNIENRKTYLLIRNGENIYRVFTENVTIEPRLFPRKQELQELFDTMEKEQKDAERWGSEDRKRDAKKKVDVEVDKYRKRALLMQGLIDRTDIFHPLPVEPLVLSKLHEIDPNGKLVRFIYDDDENLLPSGRLPFWDWHEEINRKIEAGSRILITGHYGQYGYASGKDFEERFYRTKKYGDVITYSLPPAGVYEVYSKFEERYDTLPYYTVEEFERKGLLISKGERIDKHFSKGYEKWSNHYQPEPGVKIQYYWDGEMGFGSEAGQRQEYISAYRCKFREEHLYIKYNPGGTVWNWDGSWNERKNRVSFRIKKYDEFVLNYDQISLADIEFYMESRADRINYLEMMPVLKKTRKMRIEELKGEKEFAKLVYDTNYKNFEDEEMLRERIAEAINWWKYKNKWKRPITKDDAKALRMISNRITSENYDKFEKYEQL